MTEINKYKYFAFISYSTKDTKWGKRLLRKLENYRMPSTMCKEKGWKRKPIDPVFFAPYEIQPGDLPKELKKRLMVSKNLIVIASPNSAQSDWVGKEISYFHSLGRGNNIHFFIIDGIPHSNDVKTECFHSILKELNLPEILGANINDKFSLFPWINRERAYVQLITKLLDVEFNSVWQRHKRMLIRHAICWLIGIIVVISGFVEVRRISLPVDVKVSLNEISYQNTKLPPLSNAKVILELNGTPSKEITISSLLEDGVFGDIRHSYLGKKAHLIIQCAHYQKVDTTLLLSEKNIVNMRRDEKFFGQISFQLCDSLSRPIKNIPVYIESYKVITDNDGMASIFIPLKEQKPAYHVTSTIPLADDSIPMPCENKDYVILTK